MPDCSLSPDEQPRIATLRSYGILDTPAERDFDELCQLAAHVCGTPIAVVNFIDAQRQWFKSEVGLGVRELPLDDSICRYAILEDDALVVPDTLEDDRFRHNPLCTGGPKLRFYAGAVLRTPEGFALGTICVLGREPRRLEPAQLGALRTLAHQIMTLLELRRQTAEVRQLADMRSRLSAQLARADPLPTILDHCARTLVDLLGGAFARVWTLDEADQTLLLQASAGLYTHLDGAHGRVKVGEYKIGRIAQNRAALLTNDVRRDPNISDPAWAAREGMVAFAGYPLLVEDRLVGVMALFWKHAVSEAVLSDLAPVADNMAQCIERKGVEESLRQRERMALFLSQASADLAEILDHQSTLQKIASTSVPVFADWCTIDLQDGDGQMHRLAVSHVDPVKASLLETLRRRFPPSLEDARGVGAVLRTGEPDFVTHVTESFLAGFAQNEEHLRTWRELGCRSFLCVPITWRGKVLGALSYVYAESARHYTPLHLQVAMDLARRAAIAMENAHLYFELREADRRKDEFLATLAHELRNPLAPLRNALTLLKAGEGHSPAFAETRDLMDRQLQQMVRLVDDLLDVSRITRNRIELRKSIVRLDEVAKSATELSRGLIDRGRHTLEVRLPPEPVFLFADPTRLAQIFSNLLNNAAKYTEDGGRIVLSADRDGAAPGRIQVRVSDTGSGIAPEMLAHVFELFAQEDRSLARAQGGLGIGLSLVRRLVELHGGRVTAHSAGRGRGSEFVVDLPEASPLDHQLFDEATPASRAAPAVPLKRRILVVDDNRDAATTLTKLLLRRGHEVETAFDGEEAVSVAAGFQPEIVLLDIGLPKLNGYEAAGLIRRQTTQASLMLIALTGWGQEDDRRRAAQAGFTHHMVKPVVFEDLLTLLE